MIQTLTRNWYLLGLCGILNAITAILYLLMYDAGPDTPPFPGWHSGVVLLSRLAVLAGVCAITAAIWRSAQGVSWALFLNGLALAAFGLIPLLARGPLSFRLFAILSAVMAVSFGVLASEIAGTMQRPTEADKWLLRLTAAESTGFAVGFLCLANDWIQLERRPFHPAFFLWLCLFFAFSGAGMLALALRLRTLGPGELLSPSVHPRHAH